MEKGTEPGLSYSALIAHPDHIHAIGLITVEISHLETTLAYLFGVVTGLDQMMAETIYLTPRSAFARLEMLENALAYRRVRDKPIPEIEAIHRRVKAVMGKRHGLIHEAWATNSDGALRVDNLPWKRPTPITMDELNNLVRNIRAVNHDGYAYLRSVSTLKKDGTPLSDISPPPPPGEKDGS